MTDNKITRDSEFSEGEYTLIINSGQNVPENVTQEHIELNI